VRSTAHVLAFLLIPLLSRANFAADENAETSKKPKVESSKLDPRGRPEERLLNQERRYYVWHDDDGWHLRSASMSLRKFEGAIRVVGGEFRKCRPIGLDSRGTGADRWELNKERTELKFLISTSTSFDGFDFDCGQGATHVEFDLTVAGAKEPKRIFIGRDAKHPRTTAFRFPAEPDKASGK
jgi:hypothetical protein